MSVVDLGTNKAIGSPLISWDEWPVPDLSNSDSTHYCFLTSQSSVCGKLTRDIADFNVTIPDSLSSACDVGGKCVLQWYWYASGNKQTYESCLDFYVKT
jgi:hypothetical protein